MKKIIATDKAPAAIGPYSQAIEIDKLLFTSGQIPLDPATGQVVEGDVSAQARRVFDSIKAIIEAAGLTMDDIIKTTCFLSDIGNFGAVNDVYGEYFNEGSYPARSAVEVARLPKDVLLEIETIAVKK